MQSSHKILVAQEKYNTPPALASIPHAINKRRDNSQKTVVLEDLVSESRDF